MIFAVMLCDLSSRERKAWKVLALIGLETLTTVMPVQCPPYMLRYQANWEQVIAWVYDKPVDKWIQVIKLIKIFRPFFH